MSAVLALILVACGTDQADPLPAPGDGQEPAAAHTEDARAEASDEVLTIVASTTVLADLTEQVAGRVAEVVSIVSVGGDPHVHEPTPGDARLLNDADLVIHNGVGLEPWLVPLLTRAGVASIAVADDLGAELLHEDDGEPDPHLWMAPPYAQRYLERIAEAVSDLVPDRAATISEDLATATTNMEELDAELAERLSTIPDHHRKLVTSHDAYAYFARHYDLEVVGTVVGVSTEEEPSARRIGALVDAVREQGVPTIFVETTVSPDVIESIARDAGVEVGDPLYGDSLGPPGSGADDYAGMMRSNVDALVAGLAVDQAGEADEDHGPGDGR